MEDNVQSSQNVAEEESGTPKLLNAIVVEDTTGTQLTVSCVDLGKFGTKQDSNAYVQEELPSTTAHAELSNNVEMVKFGILTLGNVNVNLLQSSTEFTVSQILAKTEECGTMTPMLELAYVQTTRYGIQEHAFHQE